MQSSHQSGSARELPEDDGRFSGVLPQTGRGSGLATQERVALTTQKQALNALVFSFREVERKELGDFGEFTRARPRVRASVVLSRSECERGLPGVWLPEALERKWSRAGELWEWQWFWPSRELMNDPRTIGAKATKGMEGAGVG